MVRLPVLQLVFAAGGVTALLWWCDTASYDKLCLTMFSGMTFCLILYMMLPNGLDIRPTVEALGRDNIAMRIMQLLWKADASVNVCPSIHCQSSACMALAFSHSKLAKERPALKVLAWVWARSSALSTVFTKQHSIIDVVCGLARGLCVGAGGVPFPKKNAAKALHPEGFWPLPVLTRKNVGDF